MTRSKLFPRLGLTLLAWALAWAAAGVASAQGLLVNVTPGERVRLPRPIIVPPPEPPVSSYKIKELDVHVQLQEQVAKVQVTQSFVNTGSRVMEVCFMFPLPYDGAIDQLTLLVDGKEFAAKLLEKGDARRIYEGIVRKNQDPALLEWMGAGMFQTSVFPVPPGAERKVTLRYSQLCKKDRGLTDFTFPLSTARYTSQPLEKLNVQVAITSQTEIKNVYSPTHGVEIKRDSRNATVTFKAENQIPTSDFRLFYDVGAGQLGTGVLSYHPRPDEDGFFLMLASPEIKADSSDRPKKTVLFVVDRSGSMSGEKIEQAKGALKFVLNNLREGDMFNIVAYDTAVESFRPELEKFNDETRKAALGYVEGLYAGGGTNIDGALAAALAQIKDTTRPNYVLFLTDGLPTVGETNEMRIVANTKKTNQVHARVVAFGVGYDVNSRLLDKLARSNFGQSEYVRPNENIEDRVSRLYAKIEAPVMTDLAISFSLDELRPEDGGAVNRVYPKDSFDLFEGEQLVIVGRYKMGGVAKVTVKGSVAGQPKAFDFPADLAKESRDETYAFVEKLWALRRVGELIDEMDLNGQNPELVRELVQLSTQHGILTPYTSFLADENTPLHELARNASIAGEQLEAKLKETEGRSGVAQRAAKGSFRGRKQALDSSAKSAPAPAAGDARRLAGGGGFGGGVANFSVYQDEETDQEVVVAGCQTIGAKTFFCRNQQWIDSTVTDEMVKNAKHVTQFSDEYFELADKHGKKLCQYLAFDEPVMINLDGEAYLIEVQAPEEGG